jgi:hypothetical protein
VTEPETGPRTNDEAADARVKKWVSKVDGVTLLLLAGFSFTSVIVTSSDDASKFLLPGLTILTLVVALAFRHGRLRQDHRRLRRLHDASPEPRGA